MIKISKIEKLTFHRNGVHGNPFYSVVVITGKEKYLITFESETDKTVNIATSRALLLSNLQDKYRGDEFGRALNKYFANEMKETKSIYDLIK